MRLSYPPKMYNDDAKSYGKFSSRYGPASLLTKLLLKIISYCILELLIHQFSLQCQICNAPLTYGQSIRCSI